MSHSGTLAASSKKASSVWPSEKATELASPAPCLRSSIGKRRRATRLTSAGVIIKATSTSDSSTMTGTASATTIIGASTARKPCAPMASSHCRKALVSSQPSSVARTPSMAAS